MWLMAATTNAISKNEITLHKKNKKSSLSKKKSHNAGVKISYLEIISMPVRKQNG